MQEKALAIDFESPRPYYSQLKQILMSQIEQGIWRNGDALPSHSELCEQYQVSRSVVRQALKELEDEGRVIQRKGRLATVATPKISGNLLANLSGTYEDLAEKGYYAISQTLKQVVVPASNEIAERLALKPGEKIIEIERLRFVKDEPFVLVSSFLPYALCPIIKDTDLTNKSLLAILRSEYGIVITSSRRSIETCKASAHEAKLLQIKKGDPLFLFNSLSYMDNGKVMGCSRAFFRGDRARFEVDLGQMISKE